MTGTSSGDPLYIHSRLKILVNNGEVRHLQNIALNIVEVESWGGSGCGHVDYVGKIRFPLVL